MTSASLRGMTATTGSAGGGIGDRRERLLLVGGDVDEAEIAAMARGKGGDGARPRVLGQDDRVGQAGGLDERAEVARARARR